MESEVGKGIPVWVKVVVGVAVVWITAGIVLVAIGCQWIASVLPNHKTALAVSEKIVQFRKPLPKDWQFETGVDAGPMKFAVMRNTKNSTCITFTRYPGAAKRDATARGAEAGARMEEIERGTEMIAGHQMAYARGHSSSRTPMAMQIGFITADNGDLVMIHAIEPSERKFDPTLIQDVMQKVESVH